MASDTKRAFTIFTPSQRGFVEVVDKNYKIVIDDLILLHMTMLIHFMHITSLIPCALQT